MIRYNYRRKKPPRFYDAKTGQRYQIVRHVMQDGADFYVEPRAVTNVLYPARRIFRAHIKVTDFDIMAAGKARHEFKAFAKKRGWLVNFAKEARS